ncbi:MAG: U32 family peptidase [Candidatus Cloacimonetes bacterium]|jgi:putative protease|nr:U32 family peptidase [Candidatus Cloacimonadota bacterium]MDD2507157.1 U32 family peptidase [Candidatus Cloacimonadota bacterium]MDD4147874.1 U32 family peptidase [Candidatus Cloacimonadota bacterium]MDD4560595.1 U32 family peptidase [Candidatus Cloacimonadota bacterium]
MELTAPGGDLNKIKYAITYGADAVYCGYNLFGLRATATNLSKDELKEAIHFAHEHNAKLYLTLNAYLKNSEYAQLKEFLLWLKDSGIDAVIVSDPGVFSMVKSLTGIPIHISTQANVCSVASARFWYEQGAKRIVAAREMSFSEILETKAELPDLEIECFIHGAMCVAYSGRCLLSAYFNRRSANSGSCTQVCRWKWALTEQERPGVYLPVEEDQYGSYILSSKDLCMLDRIPLLKQAGIDAGKIEGRMKSEYYVAQTCRVYRKAMDTSSQDTATWEHLHEELEKVSHRPYWEGFFDFPDGDAGIIEKSFQGSYTSNSEYCGKIIAHEKGRMVLDCLGKISLNDTIELVFPDINQDIRLRVSKIYDDDNQELECTRPNAYFKIPLAETNVVGALIRRCVD